MESGGAIFFWCHTLKSKTAKLCSSFAPALHWHTESTVNTQASVTSDAEPGTRRARQHWPVQVGFEWAEKTTKTTLTRRAAPQRAAEPATAAGTAAASTWTFTCAGGRPPAPQGGGGGGGGGGGCMPQ